MKQNTTIAITTIGTMIATMTAAVSGDTVDDEDVESLVVPDVDCAAVADLVEETGAMVGLPVGKIQDVGNLSAV